MSENNNFLKPSLLRSNKSDGLRWRQEGQFIVDSTGDKVALMLGDPSIYELLQLRIVTTLNALGDIPTQYIEELLEKCDNNIILTLVAKHRADAESLRKLEQKIVAHCREIEQLREMMEGCRIFEEQRALLKQAPGASEYEALLRTLGIRKGY